jgi:hypothetical protein
MKASIGKGINLDISRLVETRLLIQASSGGGKSMTLRTILENTFGQVPHIILDVEGEFSTLREKYDYILAGKGGDIPVDARIAPMLARKMLELNASVIIDLYELKHLDKHRFVHLFLEALIDAPKELWGPRLIVIDEAHQFCPEKGSGVSEAWETVIDLCEKGRKRGLGSILATQRLSKLSKDAAAECQNKIIGLANIDIDRERAARELGFTRKEDIISLRDMEPGEFYCIGPALCRTVTKTTIHLARTSHPKIGKRVLKAPVATVKVRHLLDKLKDLPQEAEKELKTQAEMLAEIRRLKMELKVKPVSVVAPVISKREILLEKLVKQYSKILSGAKQTIIVTLEKALKEPEEIPSWSLDMSAYKKWDKPIVSSTPTKQTHTRNQLINPEKYLPILRGHSNLEEDDKPLGGSEKEILGFLLLHPDKYFTKQQIGAMIHRAWRGGSFATYISRLRSKGYVEGSKAIKITESGTQTAMELGIQASDDSKVGLENWLNKLGGGAKKIYEVVLNEPERVFTKEELGEATNLESRGGSFSTYISRLCTLGLIVRENGGIRLNPEIQNL